MSTDPWGQEQIADLARSTSLADRHVIVTGAGRGLGRAIALSLVVGGARVTAIARGAADLAETQRRADELVPGSCRTEPHDVTDLDALDALVGRLDADPVHGVVHAAAVQVRRPALEVTPEDWRAVVGVGLEAAFFLTTAVARRQLADGRVGSHVFIGSLNSTIGLAGVAPYAAAKTGMLGVVRVLSTELARSGIRTNVVAPGYVRTAMTDDLLSDERASARILGRIPMGALGAPADVAGAVLFLLSDAARYVTGQVLNVDGGWLAS